MKPPIGACISSAPELDLDDETLDFEPQPGAILINETCGDLGHGMEIICGQHWAMVILKHIPAKVPAISNVTCHTWKPCGKPWLRTAA